MEEALTSPVLDSEILKPSKREGNHQGDVTISQAMPTHAKPSRRTTSLLNLFISNSQGMFNNFIFKTNTLVLGCFIFTGSREGRAGPCSAPSSPTNPGEGQQISRNSHRGSKCNELFRTVHGSSRCIFGGGTPGTFL